MYGSAKATKPKNIGLKHYKATTYLILVGEIDKSVRYYDAVELSILELLKTQKANEVKEELK